MRLKSQVYHPKYNSWKTVKSLIPFFVLVCMCYMNENTVQTKYIGTYVLMKYKVK